VQSGTRACLYPKRATISFSLSYPKNVLLLRDPDCRLEIPMAMMQSLEMPMVMTCSLEIPMAMMRDLEMSVLLCDHEHDKSIY
jgi:hypothetical protein